MQSFKNNHLAISSHESPPDSPTLASMYMQIHKQRSPPPPPEFSNLRPRQLNRSTFAKSVSEEDFHTSKPAFNPSPASILTPHLTTILSGKEFCTDELEELTESSNSPPPPPPPRQQRRQRKIRGSKSLTSLECEEIKGFMDLGFVFSEKDKDSRLVSILPGLQKLGKTEESEEDEKKEKRKIVKRPLMNLRVSVGSDVELKDRLRMWAHTVASTVR